VNKIPYTNRLMWASSRARLHVTAGVRSTLRQSSAECSALRVVYGAVCKTVTMHCSVSDKFKSNCLYRILAKISFERFGWCNSYIIIFNCIIRSMIWLSISASCFTRGPLKPAPLLSLSPDSWESDGGLSPPGSAYSLGLSIHRINVVSYLLGNDLILNEFKRFDAPSFSYIML